MEIKNYIKSPKKFNVEELLNFLATYLNISDDVQLTIAYNNKLLNSLSTDNLKFTAILCNPVTKHYVLYIREGCGSQYTLCHEMVHLHQYERGDLKISSDYKTVTWKGDTFDTSTSYEDREWEKEAFSKQGFLWKQFKKHKRKQK